MRSQKSRILLIVMVVSVALTAVAPAAVMAQENETSTPQMPDPPTETPDSSSSSNTTYQLQINDDTRIVNSSWDRGTVTFVIESDISQLIVVTDSSINMQAQKAGQVPQLHTGIPKGRTKVSFTVQNPGDAVVTVNSKRDLIFLSPGRGSSPIIGGPWSATDVRASAIGSVISVSLVTMFFVFRRIRSPSKEGDRIA